VLNVCNCITHTQIARLFSMRVIRPPGFFAKIPST
jgi:hypothetical protein